MPWPLLFLLRLLLLAGGIGLVARLFEVLAVQSLALLFVLPVVLLVVDALLRPVLNLLLLPLQLLTLGLGQRIVYGALLLVLIAVAGISPGAVGLVFLSPPSFALSIQILLALWVVCWTLLDVSRPD